MYCSFAGVLDRLVPTDFSVLTTKSRIQARLPAHAEASLCNDTVKCAANCQTPWAPVGCEKDRCAVWGLSQTTTGMSVKFATRATQVHVRVTMEIENGDWLWPVNGHSGVDYFVQSQELGS